MELPKFGGFNTFEYLAAGDNRPTHIIGITDNDYDLLTRNKILAWVECNGNVISKQEFDRREIIDNPDLIKNWAETISEAHKKDCPL